jgi:hypothetical protein
MYSTTVIVLAGVLILNNHLLRSTIYLFCVVYTQFGGSLNGSPDDFAVAVNEFVASVVESGDLTMLEIALVEPVVAGSMIMDSPNVFFSGAIVTIVLLFLLVDSMYIVVISHCGCTLSMTDC